MCQGGGDCVSGWDGHRAVTHPGLRPFTDGGSAGKQRHFQLSFGVVALSDLLVYSCLEVTGAS